MAVHIAMHQAAQRAFKIFTSVHMHACAPKSNNVYSPNENPVLLTDPTLDPIGREE